MPFNLVEFKTFLRLVLVIIVLVVIYVYWQSFVYVPLTLYFADFSTLASSR